MIINSINGSRCNGSSHVSINKSDGFKKSNWVSLKIIAE